MKKTYKIPCSWEMYGIMEVEADSITEAIDYACTDAPLPTDGWYLDESFEIDHETGIKCECPKCHEEFIVEKDKDCKCLNCNEEVIIDL